MGALNPEWLSIEAQSIDAAVENWGEAVRSSYQATLQSLTCADASERPNAASLNDSGIT
jgi:hypothetical protein